MADHFPDGYEIIRAEEVVEGQRVLDKSRKSEFETDPTIAALNQKIQFAKLAQTTSTQQKDSLPILESRIIYRRRIRDEPHGHNGFAASAKTKPEFYLDPNDMARCREQLELAEIRKSKLGAVAEKSGEKPAVKAALAADKPVDDSAQKASHDSTVK
jgi:hypothetical protein